MPLEKVLIAIPVIALVTFFTRALPFIFFSRRKPPAALVFLEKYIPPMVMMILVIYCFKDTVVMSSPYGLPELVSVIAVIAVHLLLKNPLVSIFGGTVLYMALVQSKVIEKMFM